MKSYWGLVWRLLFSFFVVKIRPTKHSPFCLWLARLAKEREPSGLFPGRPFSPVTFLPKRCSIVLSSPLLWWHKWQAMRHTSDAYFRGNNSAFILSLVEQNWIRAKTKKIAGYSCKWCVFIVTTVAFQCSDYRLGLLFSIRSINSFEC